MDSSKKAMLAALGTVIATKEKAEEIIDGLIKRGETSAADLSASAERLLDEAGAQKGRIESELLDAVQKSMNALGFPSQKDFESIQKRLGEIEKTLETMRNDKGESAA